MAAKITGTVDVLVNSEKLLNKAGATANGLGISGEPSAERKAVVGDGGIHGFVDEPVEARCEVTITDRSDIKLDTLARINGDGTLVFRSKTGGKVYTMPNATCVMNFGLTAGEGETTIAFVGSYWIETVED
jgi:hypothetical protein